MNKFFFPTIVALGTPCGVAALHIIRMTGSQAFDVINQVTLYPVDQEENFKGQLNYILGPNKQVIDQVIIWKFIAPITWTGENMIEINCHGNMVIVQLIIEQLIKHGAQPAGKGEFAKRAFLNGKIDLNQAASILPLIEGKNPHQVYAAAYNLQGNLSVQIRDFQKEILQILGEIEINIDYPEEFDQGLIKEFNNQLITKTKAVLTLMEKLLKQSQNYKNTNWRIVLVGRTNAGKSSLLNAWLNYDRAIVSPLPGTTRDAVEVEHYFQGHLVTIVDTAGIHNSNDPLEQLAIAKSMQEIKRADLILHVIDATKLNHPEDLVIKQFIGNKLHLVVYTKKDQLTTPPPLPLLISSQTGELQPLIEQLKGIFEQENTESSGYGLVYQTGINDLALAVQQLQLALTGLQQQLTIDLLAEHYQNAYDHLNKILGLGEQDLATTIFDQFCVGK